jgi:hypothetical protein
VLAATAEHWLTHSSALNCAMYGAKCALSTPERVSFSTPARGVHLGAHADESKRLGTPSDSRPGSSICDT